MEEESVSSILGCESVGAQQDPSLHLCAKLGAKAGRARMCVHFTRRSSYSIQGALRPEIPDPGLVS